MGTPFTFIMLTAFVWKVSFVPALRCGKIVSSVVAGGLAASALPPENT